MRAALRVALSCAVSVSMLACAARPALAVVVERVVAVIGDRPILHSELRKRARPALIQITQRIPAGPQQAAAAREADEALVQRMIDDHLIAQAADKARVAVTSDEIDAAIRNVAAAQGLRVTELLEGARRAGLSESDYREELRRQILEGKMLQLRVRGRVRIAEEDLKAKYGRTLHYERKLREYRAAWIVLHIPAGSSPAAVSARQALADKIVREARGGADFNELARKYSDDPQTRDSGGDLGIRAPNGSPQAIQSKRPVIAPELEGPLMPLEAGQLTDPIRIGENLIILQLLERQPSRYHSYDEAKSELFQLLQSEILEKAKRQWLDELKGRTHVEVRL